MKSNPRYFLYSAISSLTASTVIAPLDYIKIKKQAYPAIRVKSLLRNNTLRSFYRGHAITLLSTVPSKTLFLGIYDTLKNRYEIKNKLILVATANAITSYVVNPWFYIRTRMRASDMPFRHVFSEAFRKKDPLIFFRGVSVTLIGCTAKNWIFFSIYDRLRDKYPSLGSVAPISTGCKLFASVVTYPYETIRTRLRMGETLDNILRSRNRLYSGLSTHIIRSVPNTVLIFMIYEFLKGPVCSKKS